MMYSFQLHMEEESKPSGNAEMADGTTSAQDQGNDPRGHRRGYSMSDQNQSLLTQLIGEASTKLVAHCEQVCSSPLSNWRALYL